MVPQELKYWFAKITAKSPFFFAVLDPNHRYVLVSERYCKIAALSQDELIGYDDKKVLGESFYSHLAPFYKRAFNGESLEAEVVLADIDIDTTLHFALTPLVVETDVNLVLFHAYETSEKQLLTRSLEEAEDKFKQLTSMFKQGVLIIEHDEVIFANAAATSMLGFEKANELIGEVASQIFCDSKNNSLKSPLAETLTEEPLACKSSQLCGIQRDITLSAKPIRLLGDNAKLVIIEGQQMDVLPATKAANIITDPHIDGLTGLYNRTGFANRVDKLINRETPLVLLYLDIDNFKNINDSLGHHIGDNVITEVASRLKRLLPQNAILGHLGADEFGLVLPEPENDNMAEMLSERIISLINQPFNLNYFSKRLACSIGSVKFPGNGTDARILLQNADTAMYEAKARGRNRMIPFDESMNKEARTRLWLEIELQKALQQSGLEVWYQPKVNARDYSINGAEALVRWKHPVEGYISPAAFIPVAEKAGLIEHLGRVVMREVFSTVKRWSKQGLLPGRVAINLSPEQFGNPKLIDYMEKLMRSTQVDPNHITFELTESAVMSNSDHTLNMLNAIKKLGFSLSIDDFGTGYSSLAYLARFPIDELKIDRAFISELEIFPKQVTVIENIVNLGKSLDLTVVAEGVETQQQAMLLSSLKCNSIQGFHFHRPQPRHEVEALFVQHRRSSK